MQYRLFFNRSHDIIDRLEQLFVQETSSPCRRQSSCKLLSRGVAVPDRRLGFCNCYFLESSMQGNRMTGLCLYEPFPPDR